MNDRGENGVEKRELVPGASLSEVFEYSDGLTHERNSKYLETPAHRILHLSRGGAEVAKAVIVEDKKILPVVASKILLRIWGVIESIKAKDEFIEILMQKYPESGCSYCGQKPCQCGIEKANDYIKREPSEEQRTWSLSDWQKHFRSVYGAKNDGLTLDTIALKLNAEIGEVSEAGLLSDRTDASVRGAEYREKIISELVDCFAWVIGICNHHEVNANLETTFIARYGEGCPNCGQYPCVCGEFTYIDERKVSRTS